MKLTLYRGLMASLAALLAGSIPSCLLADNGPTSLAEATLIRAYSEYKFHQQGSSPLRNAKEDWSSAKRSLSENPAVRQWVNERTNELTAWISKGGDKAEWDAGWGHNFVDPRTGNPLVWSVDTPEPDTGTAGGKLHAAWVYHRRTKNIEMTLEAARLAELTDNAHFRQWAEDQLTFYAHNYRRWPNHPAQGISRMMWQSLDEATNGIVLADAARLLTPRVPFETSREWREGLFVPLLQALDASNTGVNNISVWQASAAGVIALTISDEVAWHKAINGPNGIDAMLRKGVLGDYLWFEPSSGYGRFTLYALSNLFVIASLSGKGDSLSKEMLLTQDMLLSYATLRYADGGMPAYGDSPVGAPALPDYLIRLTQRTMPIKIPRSSIDWGQLLDADQPNAPLPLETQSRVWRESQLAFLRSGGWELFTSWGQRTKSHAQQDALSYAMRYGNVEVTGPPGVIYYGSPLFSNYLRKSSAHNMALIDGAGQTTLGPGVLLKFSPSSLTATNPGYSEKVKVERSFDVDGRVVNIDTIIQTSDGAGHRLGSIFNTGCAVTTATKAKAAASPAGEGLSEWTNVQMAPAAAEWSGKLSCKGKDFKLNITADLPGNIFLAKAPDAKGALRRTVIYFEVPSSSRLAIRQTLAPLL